MKQIEPQLNVYCQLDIIYINPHCLLLCDECEENHVIVCIGEDIFYYH